MDEITNDLIWKLCIENHFEDFMRFFAPDISGDIDFGKGFETLNKELAALAPISGSRDRRCDELLKVRLKGGGEQFVLLHLEVQGYRDAGFAERMFTYFYRIKDKYQQRIYPLAIYTHGSRSSQPNAYTEEFYGMALSYKFPVYILADQRIEALKADDNPFALVALAGIYALKSRNDQQRRKAFKRELLRMLAKKEWEKQKIIAFFEYLNAMVKIKGLDANRELIDEFIDHMNERGEDMKLDWRTALANEAKEEGLKEGLKKGLKEGLNKGIKAGLDKGKTEIVISMLKEGLDETTVQKISKLPLRRIQELKHGISRHGSTK